jgi:hypothetical protein
VVLLFHPPAFSMHARRHTPAVPAPRGRACVSGNAAAQQLQQLHAAAMLQQRHTHRAPRAPLKLKKAPDAKRAYCSQRIW